MKKIMKGFTLLELMIVLVVSGILATIIGAITGVVPMSPETYQRGGTICKSGYQWNVDMDYHQRQVLNENGGGVRCQ
ncbi:MAG: prepilin-type N-terminal cleavage/methylation domain-containing protein [Bacteroidales bacterium]|jgi:prepilin-type N-terminal cleavage/methylation domain-containing protein